MRKAEKEPNLMRIRIQRDIEVGLSWHDGRPGVQRPLVTMVTLLRQTPLSLNSTSPPTLSLCISITDFSSLPSAIHSYTLTSRYVSPHLQFSSLPFSPTPSCALILLRRIGVD